MENYVPPVRGARWVVATAVLAVVVGVVAYLVFAARIDRRIADGVPVSAEVTKVQRLPVGKSYQPQRITVTYDRSGGRTAGLVSALEEGDYRVGQRLTVLVDPTDPDKVATAEGFASEGLILLVPPAVAFYGLFACLFVAIRRGRWWWRHERRMPTSVPLLTVTGSREDEAVLDWSWAKGARWITAAAAEVSTGRTGPLRLLVYIRIGVRGKPRIAHYSKRSRRLVVIGTVAPAVLSGNPAETLRDVVGVCLGLAERWNARHRRGADMSVLVEAVRALDSYQDED